MPCTDNIGRSSPNYKLRVHELFGTRKGLFFDIVSDSLSVSD